MKTLKTREIGCALAVAAAAGCSHLPSIGPDYEAPEAAAAESPAPDAGYPTGEMTATGEFKAAEGGADPRKPITAETIREWWTQFDDPVLTNIIASAVSSNLDFRMANERLVQARWALVGSAAAFMPKVTMDGTYARSGAHAATGSGRAHHGDRWSSGFDASWEIDVFGGSRRAWEAADASLEAAGFTLEHAWVSLTSEIGREYVTLRTVQDRLRVARANLKLQSETYDILKSRLDSGIGDELAVNQAKYNVEQTRAGIPALLASEERCRNALAILAGRTPGELHGQLGPVGGRDWLLPPQKLDAIPLDALRTRPDVRAAERRLAAQTAAVGMAASMMLPKFYMNGSLGLESVSAGRLFSRDAFLGSIGPSFSWPLFQGGNRYAEMKKEESKMNEAAFAYELAVQKAYGEARDAYSAYTQQYHRHQSLQGAVKAATDAVNISQDLYKNGLADFNNVLDAQRSLLVLEEALTVSRGDITLNLIALYKALGGGLVL